MIVKLGFGWHLTTGRFGLTRKIQPAAGPGNPANWREAKGWRRWRYGAAFTAGQRTMILDRWGV